METIPVTLIVKAPNQQFEDQTIKCELSWTIKRLKGYLSEVYPCKPSTEEQKLIYSGQLLHDAVVLKDVLRQYEGQETHTVHLVYTPRMRQDQQQRVSMDQKATPTTNDSTISSSQNNSVSASPQSSSSSGAAVQSPGQTQAGLTEGLRQRHVSGRPEPSASTSGVPPSYPVSNPPMINSTTLPMLFQSQQYPGNFGVQQMAYQNWVQQQYLQYMNQYMNYMATNGQSGNPLFQSPGFFGQPPNFQMPLTAGAGSLPHDGNSAANNAVVLEPEDPAGQQREDQLNRPRFPVMAQDNDAENRDWLDDINSLVRLTLFLTMIYFYSSPLRCLLVVVVGVGLYFYYHRQRIRAILFRNVPQNRVNLVPLNPHPPPPNEVAAENPDNNNNNLDQTNRNVANQGGEDGGPEGVIDTTQQEQNNTVLAFIRTFVTSFFASLIPDPA